MTETAAGESDSLRLFFALWPDDATRTALNQTGRWLHKHWGGRRMRADTLHLTLAFLGRTPVAQLDALTASVDAIQAKVFELALDQAGYWHHNKIGWLGPSQPPSQLGALVDVLAAAIQQSGIAFDARPHVPHVTLLRNMAGGGVSECTPVHWSISDFVLVASRTETDGAHYDVIRRWPLGRQA
ncbi:MAG TPA: RNA 2',3'-cyclic phosphodiesterase [Thiobacillus sp.]